MTKRYKCLECETVINEDEIMVTRNPFDTDIEINGCPNCFAIDSLRLGCYEPRCNKIETMTEKLKALLEGLEIECSEYWLKRTEKELKDLGICINNGIGDLKLDRQQLVDALIACSDRIRIMQDNGRAKRLDNMAVEQADFALLSVGIIKND